MTVMFNPLLKCSRGKEHIVLRSKLKKQSIDSFGFIYQIIDHHD